MAEIKVPALGESVTEATVSRWLKKPGEAVAMDEALVELETDKVNVEVNAPAAGVMGEQAVAEGATVNVGALLGTVPEGGAPAATPGPRPPKTRFRPRPPLLPQPPRPAMPSAPPMRSPVPALPCASWSMTTS